MKAARLVPLAGVLTVVGFVLAFAIGGDTPDGDDPIAKVVSFYRDNDSDQILAAIFLVWGTALFLLFASGLWRVLRNAETERRGSSTLLLLGAAVFAVAATIFAGLTFTLGDFADDLRPVAIQTLNALNSDMFGTLVVGTFAFGIGAGASIIGTGGLPKWLGWVAVVIGAVALTPIGFFAFLALGAWVLAASVVLFLRGDATPAPAAP